MSSVSGASTLVVRAPLIGRSAELAVLSQALAEVRDRRVARAVTMLGVGGIGKSRLVEELLGAEVQDRALRVHRGSARSLSHAYGIFSRLLRSRFGIADGLDPDAARELVRAQVSEVLDDRRIADVCFFLGKMMDLEFPHSPLTKAVAHDPREAAHLRRAIVRSFFEADAGDDALVLVLEDLQSADDDSLELLGYLIGNLVGPVLILGVSRPELLARRSDWFEIGQERHRRLDLQPLDADAAGALARAMLAPCEAGVPHELEEASTQMAGGNPGLIEQMVRVFHDAEVLRDVSLLEDEPMWKVDLEKLASARLPVTVDDAVATRIAALASTERRVLEHAAAMGSVFWFGGLVALARMDAPVPEFWAIEGEDVAELRTTLADLVLRDHVLEMPDSTFPGESEYVFKHNREREKIASLVSPATLKRYHQTVATWLGQKDDVRSQEEHCAMLAEHLERGGARVRAALTYLDAADIARDHFRPAVADEYYKKGLTLLGGEDDRRRVDACHNHGDVALILGRRDDALAAFKEMLALGYRLGILSKGGAAHDRIGRLLRDSGALKEARRHFETALELFRAAGDERGVAACHDDIGQLLWLKGEYEAALVELRTGLELREAIGDRRSIAVSLSHVGRMMLDHGQLGPARDALENALGIRREIGDPLGTVESLVDLGRLAQSQADPRRALSLFREAYAMAVEIGERHRMAVVLTAIGQTNDELGDVEQAVKVLKEAQELCRELGDTLELAQTERALAEVYLKQGDLRKAREAIKHAVDLFGQVRNKPHLAAAVRILGEVTAAGAWGKDHRGKAVDYFMRSITICKEIGNELETAKSYKAFVNYVRSSEEFRDNAEVHTQADRLDRMAEEILERRKRAPTAR
jgi:predicted ATPase